MDAFHLVLPVQKLMAVHVLWMSTLEGSAERSATGLEIQARVTPEGSIPLPSV